MQHLYVPLIFVSVLVATACGGSPPDAKSGEDAAQPSCKCHGKGGEGTATAPAVVGPTALSLDPPSGAKVRKSQFVTVADVADFVVQNMPADAPGSLSADDYFAALAFDLEANGIDLGVKKLDATVAARLTIPRK